MTPWIFAAAAALFLMSRGVKPKARWPGVAEAEVQPIQFSRPPAAAGGQSSMVAAALAIAVIAWMAGRAGAPSSPEVQPLPGPAERLDLKGLFVGESAAADAATTAALLGELADVVEWDGKQQAPRLSTGSAIHDLRTASREIRCRGQKIGDRQPAARDKIKAYLDSSAGTEGGPLSPDARSRWVAAYREVSRAASDAIGVSPLSETPAGAVGDILILAAVAIAAWFAFLAWGRNP